MASSYGYSTSGMTSPYFGATAPKAPQAKLAAALAPQPYTYAPAIPFDPNNRAPDSIATQLAALQDPNAGAQGQAALATTSTPAAAAPAAPTLKNPDPTVQAGAGGVYDFDTDPILQQIKQLGVQTKANADTQALKLRKQLAVQYGDQALATNVLNDPLTAQAAAQNPNSITKQLADQYQQGVTQYEDTMNKQNLGYSSARFAGLDQAAKGYQGQLASATANEQSALDQIGQQLLASYAAQNQADNQAANDAYQRSLALALASQTGAPPVDTGSGTTGGTTDGSTGGTTTMAPYDPGAFVAATTGGEVRGRGTLSPAGSSAAGLAQLIASLNNTVNNPVTQPKKALPSAAVGNMGARALGFY